MEKKRRLSPFPKIHPLRNTRLFAMAMILILATSCLSTQKSGPPPLPQEIVLVTAQPKPLAPMPILAQRIQAIERIIEKKEMAEDDEKAAKDVLNTYRALQTASSKPLTLENQEKLIRKLFYSLMLVEGKFFKKTSDHPKHPPSRGSTLYIRELQFPLSKRKPSETVIASRPSLPMVGGEDPTPVTPPEDERQKALAGHGVEIGLDFNLLFQEVDSLVKRRKYEEATRLLSEAERKTAAGPAREIILRAKEQIDAEKETVPTIEDTDVRDARKIEEEAKELLEQEKYEEAISRLHAAKDISPEPNEEHLTRLKESAVTGLINRERNRAAKIFLNAKKINDPTLKREKLSVSREILADLIRDYPNSSLVPTLEQNLQVVDQTLEPLME